MAALETQCLTGLSPDYLAPPEALSFELDAAGELALADGAPPGPAAGGRLCRGTPALGSTHLPAAEFTSRSMHRGFLSVGEERLSESAA